MRWRGGARAAALGARAAATGARAALGAKAAALGARAALGALLALGGCSEAPTGQVLRLRLASVPAEAAALQLQVVLDGVSEPPREPVTLPPELVRRQRQLSVDLRLQALPSDPVVLGAAVSDADGRLISAGATSGPAAVALATGLDLALEPVPGSPAQLRRDGGPTLLSVSAPAAGDGAAAPLGPLSSSGGAPLVLRGVGFAPGARVTIGEAPARSEWRSPLELRVVAPALAVDGGLLGREIAVAVRNPGGLQDERKGLVSYCEDRIALEPLAPRPLSQSSDAPAAFAVGDIDQDGQPDVAFSTTGGAPAAHLGILFGSKDGPGAPQIQDLATSAAESLALADLNGDAQLDVVTLEARQPPSTLADLRVRYHRGDSKERSRIYLAAPDTLSAPLAFASQLLVADLDGDNKKDLLVLATDAASAIKKRVIQLRLNTGPRSFSPPATCEVEANVKGPVALADLDRNGRPDLVLDATLTAPSATPRLAVVRLTPGAVCAAPVYYPLPAGPGALADVRGLAAGDLDGDGFADVVAFGAVSGSPLRRLVVLRNLGAEAPGLLTEDPQVIAGTLLPADCLRGVALADLNGDRLSDLVLLRGCEGAPTTVTVALNSRSRDFPTGADLRGRDVIALRSGETAVIEDGRALVIADVDGDRRLDLAYLGTGGAGGQPIDLRVHRNRAVAP